MSYYHPQSNNSVSGSPWTPKMPNNNQGNPVYVRNHPYSQYVKPTFFREISNGGTAVPITADLKRVSKKTVTNIYIEQLYPLYPNLTKTQVRSALILSDNNLHETRIILDMKQKFVELEKAFQNNLPKVNSSYYELKHACNKKHPRGSRKTVSAFMKNKENRPVGQNTLVLKPKPGSSQSLLRPKNQVLVWNCCDNVVSHDNTIATNPCATMSYVSEQSSSTHTPPVVVNALCSKTEEQYLKWVNEQVKKGEIYSCSISLEPNQIPNTNITATIPTAAMIDLTQELSATEQALSYPLLFQDQTKQKEHNESTSFLLQDEYGITEQRHEPAEDNNSLLYHLLLPNSSSLNYETLNLRKNEGCGINPHVMKPTVTTDFNQLYKNTTVSTIPAHVVTEKIDDSSNENHLNPFEAIYIADKNTGLQLRPETRSNIDTVMLQNDDTFIDFLTPESKLVKRLENDPNKQNFISPTMNLNNINTTQYCSLDSQGFLNCDANENFYVPPQNDNKAMFTYATMQIKNSTVIVAVQDGNENMIDSSTILKVNNTAAPQSSSLENEKGNILHEKQVKAYIFASQNTFPLSKVFSTQNVPFTPVSAADSTSNALLPSLLPIPQFIDSSAIQQRQMTPLDTLVAQALKENSTVKSQKITTIGQIQNLNAFNQPVHGQQLYSEVSSSSTLTTSFSQTSLSSSVYDFGTSDERSSPIQAWTDAKKQKRSHVSSSTWTSSLDALIDDRNDFPDEIDLKKKIGVVITKDDDGYRASPLK